MLLAVQRAPRNPPKLEGKCRAASSEAHVDKLWSALACTIAPVLG